MLYYLFNSRDAKENAGFRLFEQKVHLLYKIPSVYTSLYTPGRKYRYYVADFSAGRNDVKDNMYDENIEEFEYQYYYEDFNKSGSTGVQPGETEAYIYGYVVAHQPHITLYHMKYGNTPTMEDAEQEQYEKWNKEKEGNTDERKTITVERRGGGDNILVAYHSLWDDSPKETYKTFKYHEGGSTLIEELKYESIQETYEYYYYTRIPGISDAYTVNHLLINRLVGYKIGLVSPKKEAVDLYNDLQAKWQATVAMAPALYSMMPEVIADEPVTYGGFELVHACHDDEGLQHGDPGERLFPAALGSVQERIDLFKLGLHDGGNPFIQTVPGFQLCPLLLDVGLLRDIGVACFDLLCGFRKLLIQRLYLLHIHKVFDAAAPYGMRHDLCALVFGKGVLYGPRLEDRIPCAVQNDGG